MKHAVVLVVAAAMFGVMAAAGDARGDEFRTRFVASSDRYIPTIADSRTGGLGLTSTAPLDRLPPLRWSRPSDASRRAARRMPGEFEQQQLLLLSCGELTPGYAQTIAEIAQLARSHIQVVVLYTQLYQRGAVDEALRQRMDSLENIALISMPHDTKWVRDYGPTILRSSGGNTVVVDWHYEEGRPKDDQAPLLMAASSRTPVEPAELAMEGGNLLSNGQGLLLTTSRALDRNADVTEQELCTSLTRQLGARELVVLEPLEGEPTGHVDMFTTFTSPDTVVVGRYTAEEDAENAAILDRNAARLAEVSTERGRLRVERIPMGLHHDGVWRTYTNCIYANGVLLMPAYHDNDEGRIERAQAVYRRLLPRWHIAPVDASRLIEEGGALHCASLNIPALAHPLQPVPLPIEEELDDGFVTVETDSEDFAALAAEEFSDEFADEEEAESFDLLLLDGPPVEIPAANESPDPFDPASFLSGHEVDRRLEFPALAGNRFDRFRAAGPHREAAWPGTRR